MDIKYLGHSSFLIKGKKVSLVTDPYQSDKVGLKFPKHIEAAIVTVSHNHAGHHAVEQLDGSPFVVNGAGEYDIQGVSVIGYKSAHDSQNGTVRGFNTMYRIEMDGISIVHLGDIGHDLNNGQVEALGDVDVLFVPVGGYCTADVKIVKSIITEIEPSIVIPMHYMTPGVNEKEYPNLLPVTVFLKEMGVETVTPLPKLSVTKDKIPDDMQIIVLE